MNAPLYTDLAGSGPEVLADDLFAWGVAPSRMSTNTLHPIEAQLCADWCERRKREFAAGRLCVYRAMKRMGTRVYPVGRDEQGGPMWPSGLVGSISHGGELAMAVIAPAKAVRAVGIDVERVKSSKDADALALVLQPVELSWIALHPQDERGRWATVIFSARESVYKCLYHMSGIRLGITQVVVRMFLDTSNSGTILYEFHRCEGAPAGGLLGRFLVRSGHVMTSAWCMQSPET